MKKSRDRQWEKKARLTSKGRKVVCRLNEPILNRWVRVPAEKKKYHDGQRIQ